MSVSTNRWLVAIIDHFEDGSVTLTVYRREPDCEPMLVADQVMDNEQAAVSAARAFSQRFSMPEEDIEWQHHNEKFRRGMSIISANRVPDVEEEQT